MTKLSARLSMLVCLVLLVGCDHATKGVAKLQLGSGGVLELIRGVLDFHYVENRDIAFSLLRWVPETIRAPALLVIGAIAVFALAVLLFRGRSEHQLRRFALVLVTAGAIGNYLDRVMHGYVVDFVHVRYWPVFNVADVYITVGYVLLALAFIGDGRSGAATKPVA